VAVDDRELDGVAAARGDDRIEPRAGEVGLDDVAARELVGVRIGGAQDRVPAERPDALAEDVQHGAEQEQRHADARGLIGQQADGVPSGA
jgi:hypothetical protein